MFTVGFLIESYEEQFGSEPSSWEDLEKVRIAPIAPAVEPRERYAFLPVGSRPKIKGLNGEIILISRRPFRDLTKREILPGILPGLRTTTLTEPLRYGLYRKGSGRIGRCTLPESEVQRIFKSQGMPLPAPDDLPERPWIAAIERRERITKAVVV